MIPFRPRLEGSEGAHATDREVAAILRDLVAIDTNRYDGDYYYYGSIDAGLIEALQARAKAVLDG